MDRYAEFKSKVDAAAIELGKLSKAKPVKIISHIDADGISACAVLIKTLKNANLAYSVTTVKQLTKGVLYDLSHDNYETFFFTDLGSGQLNDIVTLLKGKKVFILDHHRFDNDSPEIVHVNPEMFGISGSTELSGAGVAYFFYKAVTGKTAVAHIAVVGAIGDMQEDNGFTGLNKEILDDAVNTKQIEIKTGLRIFGLNSKPLYKALQYSTWPAIPGISGSESGAIQFLQELGINPKYRDSWRMFSQLTDAEVKKLSSGIIIKRFGKDKPEDIFGPIYTVIGEEDGPTKDAREYATLLNSCGRLDKASVGLGTCLGDKNSKLKALAAMKDYKRELVNALTWFEKNKSARNGKVIEKDNVVILNAGSEIRDTVIGTLASIISKSNWYKDGTCILSMARNLEDETTKLSLRMAGPETDADLKQLMKLAVLSVNGDCGGHKKAAGGRISQDKEEEFIKNAVEVFSKVSVEEKIL
jgi:single-stranded-DNA-specific exonuclease